MYPSMSFEPTKSITYKQIFGPIQPKIELGNSRPAMILEGRRAGTRPIHSPSKNRKRKKEKVIKDQNKRITLFCQLKIPQILANSLVLRKTKLKFVHFSTSRTWPLSERELNQAG